MFISKKEKAQLVDDIAYLRRMVDALYDRVFQLESWLPMGKPDVRKDNGIYRWVKEYQVPPKTPKRTMSPENREKMSRLMKKRHAEAKAKKEKE